MATSLSKIKSQIEKLQKQAASIQSTVISRIKREIEQHGLSVGDLFGSESKTPAAGRGPRATSKTSAKPKQADTARPAKFADDHGNTWHGRGLRPKWIHDALDAGRKLEEFLIGAKKQPATSGVKTAAKAAKAPAASKTAAPKKKAVSAKVPSAKRAAKAPAAKKVTKTAVAPVKVGKAATASKTTPSKRAPAKKSAPKKSARVAAQPASAPAADAPASQG